MREYSDVECAIFIGGTLVFLLTIYLGYVSVWVVPRNNPSLVKRVAIISFLFCVAASATLALLLMCCAYAYEHQRTRVLEWLNAVLIPLFVCGLLGLVTCVLFVIYMLLISPHDAAPASTDCRSQI